MLKILSFPKIIQKIKSNVLLVHSFWAILGSILLRGSGLIISIYIAKIIGAYSFGQYGMFKNFVLSLSIFSTFGLGYSATKFVAENRDNPYLIRKIVNNSNKITFIISVILSLFIFIFNDFVSIYLFKDVHLGSLVKIVAIWLFFNAMTTMQQAIISGFLDYKLLAKINAIISLLTFLSIPLIKYYMLFGAMLALLIIQIINFIINYYFLSKKIQNVGFFQKKCVEFNILDMIKLSLPITLTELSFSFFSWLTAYIMISYSNYTEFGFYNAALQWYFIILFVPGVLRNVLLSSLSSDRKSRKQTMGTMFKINLISTLIPSIMILIFSGSISNIYGIEFLKIKSVITVLCFSSIFSSLVNVIIQFLISHSYFWKVFISRFLADLSSMLLFIIAKKYIFIGVRASIIMATVILVTNIFYFLFLYLIYKKELKNDV